ncbi:FAD-dependent thymidylate synthase [Desulfovibrio sp. OttesenSCG-928-A18]|nr:FAD-dependent thymidylate synthase [Desulfovibrio sp. OttesenSCG-928-A18]
MAETQLQVELLAHTPDALSLIYAAFRQCYHAGFVADMWPRLLNGEIPREKQADFLEQVMASGHVSPIEHVSFTFAAQGVSRALTHQLVRHRIASYSQQSQRYVDGSDFNYIIPPSIDGNPEARMLFLDCIQAIGAAYRDIKGLLEKAGSTKAKEDARFLLPQAAETRIVLSMNCRSLLNFFEHRCCMRAQWEIRKLAQAMLRKCREVLPEVFTFAGARCERLGHCPEGERFTCGRYPLPVNAG